MSNLLRRLTRLAQAYVYDFVAPARRHAPPWNAESASWREARPADEASASSADSGGRHGLPFSDELAASYGALDLPFGVPMPQVSKRWKSYLKQCHPDRYAKDPEKLADATRLTQELTQAYETIKAAWTRHQP